MQDLSYPSAQRIAQAQLQSKASSGNFRVLRLVVYLYQHLFVNI